MRRYGDQAIDLQEKAIESRDRNTALQRELLQESQARTNDAVVQKQRILWLLVTLIIMTALVAGWMAYKLIQRNKSAFVAPQHWHSRVSLPTARQSMPSMAAPRIRLPTIRQPMAASRDTVAHHPTARCPPQLHTFARPSETTVPGSSGVSAVRLPMETGPT